MRMPRLQVSELSKQFTTRGGMIDVLRDVDLELQGRQSAAITGPSGSGKSTLLGILGTLETPSAGKVLLDDEEPAQFDQRQLALFRAQRVGFIFQDHYLMPQCTVLENVLLPTLALAGVTKETAEYARELINRVGLTDRIDHQPDELSGGQRQRVAIARSLINRPKLLLADEPTGNLDRKTGESVASLLTDLLESDEIILLVATHSESLAQRMQQRFDLDDGRLTLRKCG